MVWFSCSLEVSLPLSGNGIAGQMGGWTCLSLQHGHHWGPDDHPQKVHATGKSDEKTTDWYLLKQVLGNKSLQRKRNADMTHHGWTHIQRVVSMSPMRNYVPVLLGCPAGPRRFWCTVCSGTPVSEKLNEEWPPSLVPGLSVFLHTSSSSPYILPARRTVTHANYTVTGEEKTHIFFFSPQQLGLSIYLSAIYNSLRQGGLISSHHHFSKWNFSRVDPVLSKLVG